MREHDDRETLRYPIGQFAEDHQPTAAKHRAWIDRIGALPGELRALVRDLTPGQLDTPYRPGGWTVRQVVHHLPDSHLNAYVRTKLALTEEVPTIKPYDQVAWAELPDAAAATAAAATAATPVLTRPAARSVVSAPWQRH